MRQPLLTRQSSERTLNALLSKQQNVERIVNDSKDMLSRIVAKRGTQKFAQFVLFLVGILVMTSIVWEIAEILENTRTMTSSTFNATAKLIVLSMLMLHMVFSIRSSKGAGLTEDLAVWVAAFSGFL